MPRLSKYQAILKGEYQFNEFMNWAANDAPVSGHAWLPEKSENEGFISEIGRGQWIQEYTKRRGLRRVKRRGSSWIDDQSAINKHYFDGDILRPCFESEYLGANDERYDYLSEYNDYIKNEGLMYG